MKRAFYWFRQDLRLDDNLALKRAVEQVDELIPVFVIDTSSHLHEYLGFERLGGFRKRFLWESLEDLNAQLAAQDGGLFLYEGQLINVFETLRETYACDTIYCSAGLATEEQGQERDLEKQGFHIVKELDHFLFHPEDAPFSIQNTPEVYTSFRKKLEKYSLVRARLSAIHIHQPKQYSGSLNPTKTFQNLPSSIDPRSAFPFKGGRAAGLKRLNNYLWDTDSIAHYKETRNGLIGTDYSSKLSAWLSLGCLSAREIYHAVKTYEEERTKNSSTYWLIFELIWRDFFQYMLLKHGKKLFLSSGIQGGPSEWKYKPERLEQWIKGNTSCAFVNANMKEMASTGFMSNRGRQMVASYLINDLQCDWRYGAAYFESQLIDYDVASNYGNWQYIAGVGNDPRPDRYFHPDKQAERYDPDGAYRKLWLS